ncbi:MAG: elongation factor P [Alphaproteobacteria bacterium]|jgi:elongation factor P|nr:elongation factor P [Rickettsiales bacterium]
MKVDGSAVRAGMVIEYENKLWLVVKHEIRTPGNLRAFNQVELKDVKSGTKNNVRLNSGAAVERVQIDSRQANYLYADGDNLTFMDNENYDQFTLPKSLVGDALPFLQDNMTVGIEMYEGTPISVTLPGTAVCEIVDTEAVVKNQTASSSYKPAKLDNGVRVMVPPYITTGERILVKIADLSFMERVKK